MNLIMKLKTNKKIDKRVKDQNLKSKQWGLNLEYY